MVYLEVTSFILLVVLMTFGYKKNNRNLMLIASLCLLVGLAGPDFARGFQEGYQDAVSAS